MDDFLMERNKNGIFGVDNEQLSDFERPYYKKLVKANVKDIEKYVNDLVIFKANENNHDINVNVDYYGKIILNKTSPYQKYKDLKDLRNNNYFGLYELETNSLTINLNKIFEIIYYYKTRELELILLKLVYHELQHQIQYIDGPKNEILLNNKVLLDKDYRFYQDNHDYFEMEVDAEVESRKRLITDIKNNEYPIFRDYVPFLDNEVSKYEDIRRSDQYKKINLTK